MVSDQGTYRLELVLTQNRIRPGQGSQMSLGSKPQLAIGE
jgi:hypothetical protein